MNSSLHVYEINKFVQLLGNVPTIIQRQYHTQIAKKCTLLNLAPKSCTPQTLPEKVVFMLVSSTNETPFSAKKYVKKNRNPYKHPI